MMKSKFIIFAVLILALLTMGIASAQDSSSLNVTDTQDAVVSANDEVETTALAVEEVDTSNVSSDDSVLKSGNVDNDVLGVSDNFDTLQSSIINAYTNGNHLELKSDYQYSGTSDKFDGVTITNDNFVLDGNGHTIDVNNSGRIFHITGNNVTLKNLVLINGKLDSQGGVIYNEKSGLNLVNVTFKNIQARWGGVIYNTGDNLTVKDSKFDNINSTDEGGAIWNKGDNLTILNSSFNSMRSGNGGGVIYTNGFNSRVINSNFTNVIAKGNGGVIHNTGANLTLINSTFTTNVANAGDASYETSQAVGGGAVWSKGDNLTILNSTFTDNRASNDGGAIFNDGNNVIVKDSNFTSNLAKSIISFDGYGGAIYTIGANLIILNSTFTSNEGSMQGEMWRPGGAIYHIGANLTILNSTLTSNHAGIYHSGDILNITNSKFDGNSLAVNHTGDNISITNSSFINNKGNTAYTYNVYGAIWSKGNNVNVFNSTFNNNADLGLYVIGNNTTVNNSTFYGNGRGFYNSGNYLFVTNSTFTSNKGYNHGAAIYHSGSNFNVTDSIFKDNRAMGISSPRTYYSGGAIYNSGANLSVSNVTFENNFASSSGGAIYHYGANLSVSNVTFNKNNAYDDYGGAIYHYGANFNVTNVTFYSNYGDDGGDAIYNSGNYFTVRNATFESNNGGYNGVIYNNGKYFNVTNSTFKKNSEVCIRSIGSYFNIWDVIFDSNTDGAISNSASYFNITNITFYSNKGHAISNGGSYGVILNCTFVNNKVSSNGGAIYNSGQHVNITNSTFTNTTITYGYDVYYDEWGMYEDRYHQDDYCGGTIYNTGSYFNIINSNFTDSFATNILNNGGTIYNRAEHVTIINSTFTNSKADRNGGTIYNKGQYFTILNSTFTNSSTNRSATTLIDTQHIFGGGVIYNIADYFNITNSTFTDMGSGYCGGAIYNTGENFTMTDSRFTESSAKYDGGLIFNKGGNFTVVNSTFINSTADANGGMICNYGGAYFTIANSSFTNATALASANGTIYWGTVDGSLNYYYYRGGGIIWNSGASFNITNSTFINGTTELNVEGEDYYTGGGAIYTRNQNFTITNSTFINNSAKGESEYNFGGGAIYNYRGNVTVLGSKFTGNYAVDGASIYNPAKSTLYSNNNKYLENAGPNTHIYNLGNITSPVVITVLENRTISIDVYTNVSFNATIATDDGGSVAGQTLTFLLTHEEIAEDYQATTNKNGTYVYDGYYINWVAPTVVGAKYDGTSVDPIVKVGIYLTGEVPSKVTLTVSDKPAFAQDILVNATVSAAGGAELVNNNPATNGGYVIFKVMDESGKVVAESGRVNLTEDDCKASYIFKYLNAGNYTVNAWYSGNTLNGKDFFKANSTNASLEVCKVQGFKLELMSETVPVGEDTEIIVKVPEHATGNVTISIRTEEFVVPIDPETSTATLVHKFLKADDYLFTAKYNGDINYVGSDTFKGNISVTLIGNYTFIIEAPDTQFESTAIVKIHLPKDITTSVNLTIDNGAVKNKTVAITNGEGEVEITGLSMGIHNLTAYYGGNEIKYLPNSTEAKLNITPKFDYDMNVTIDHNTSINVASVNVGEDVTIKVTISKNVVGGTVYINLNNGTVLSKTVGEDGVVELTISNMVYGDNIVNKISVYNLNINYTGYGLYGSKHNDTFKIYVDKLEPNMNITIPNPVKRLETNNITVYLPKDATITEESLYLVLNGPYGSGKYYAKSIVNGIANIELPDILDVGYYSFHVHYGEDAKYWADDKYDFSFTIVETIVNYDMNITSSYDARVGEDTVISLNLPNGAKGNVSIEIDGVIYHPDIINNVASITLNNLTDGTHTVFANYSGDDTYKPSYTTGSITVSKVDDYGLVINSPDIEMGQNAIIKVTAPVDADGVIILNFNNTKLVSDIVNNVATFTIPGLTNGTYKFSATYVGNDKYTQKTNSGELVVGNSYDYDIIIDVPTDVKSGDRATINVTLPGDANGDILIKVGDIEYNTTVVNGKASITTDEFSSGRYDVNVTYKGEGSYAQKSNCTYIIFKEDNYAMNSSVKNPTKVGENATITVTVPENATGNVTVTIDGKNYTATINNGTANITLPVLPEGEQNITVVYPGDEYYVPKTNTTVVNSKGDYDLIVDIPAITDDKNATIKVTVPSDATGNITINVDGKNYTVAINNSSAEITLPILPAGKYNITTTYPGDNKYAQKTDIEEVFSKITVYDMNVTVNDPDKIGGSTTVVVEVPDDADGNITITIDDNETITVPVTNSTMNITLLVLPEGEHNITVDFTDDKYIDKQYNGTTTSKGDYDWEVIIPEITDDKNATIKVTVPDDATGNVTVTVDGKNYTVPVNNGAAEVTLPVLPAGKYDITVDYVGDDKYAPKTNATSVVSKKTGYDMNVTIPDDVKPDKNTTITVDLPDDATGNITITIDGNKTIVVPVENGTTNITIPPLGHGEHNITIDYSGDDKYVGNTTDKTVDVDSNGVKLTSDDVVMIYKDGSRLYATLLDAYGNPIANATLSFTINGITYARITDEKGVASLALNLEYGVYTATVSYDENNTVNATVTVKSSIISQDLLKMWRNDTQFYATFLDVGAKPLANTDVTFNINGILYTRTTDANGTAKLNINLDPGSYILTAYNPVSGEQRGFNVLVKSLIETTDLTKYYMNASNFKAKLWNKDGTIAANKEIRFNINGVFYTRTSDANGTVSLAIQLRPGDYIITSMYEGLSIGNKVKVLPTLETSDLSMKFQDGTTFKARTLDGQGNPLANQNITYNIHGVFYHRTTDSNGIANLNINLMPGEYIITSYWGDYETGNKISVL